MLRVVRLGTPRLAGEGLRLGTVRRLPRGVRKQEYARRDFFDLWLPELAPSDKLFGSIKKKNPIDASSWKSFARRYEAEMKRPSQQRLLALLARLSKDSNLSVGCYCEDENRCHRSILKKLLAAQGARLA